MAEPPKQKQANDPPPQRRNWAAPVGRDAGLSANAAFQRAGFTDTALVLHWPQIAGAEIARIARPVRFSEKDGTLTLLAEPAAALFLGYETRTLAERINTYLGRAAVNRVKFIQGRLTVRDAPLPTPRPAQNLETTDPANSYRGPESLKAALQSLARWRTAAGPRGD